MTVAWTAAQLARAANQAEAVRWVAVTQVAVTTGRVAVTAGSKAAAGTLGALGRPTAGSGVAAGAAAAAAAGAVAPTAAAAAVRAAPFLRRGTIQLESHSTRQEARERAMPTAGLRTTAYRSPLACPRSAAGRRASRRPYLLHRPSQSARAAGNQRLVRRNRCRGGAGFFSCVSLLSLRLGETLLGGLDCVARHICTGRRRHAGLLKSRNIETLWRRPRALLSSRQQRHQIPGPLGRRPVASCARSKRATQAVHRPPKPSAARHRPDRAARVSSSGGRTCAEGSAAESSTR